MGWPTAGEPGVCAAYTDCAAVWASEHLHRETQVCSGGATQVTLAAVFKKQS